MATRAPALDGWLGVEAVRDARERTRDLVRHTPVLTSRSVSDECGGTVLLKAENLQRTGSFKLRGALAKVDRIAAGRPGDRAGAAGLPAGAAVVAGSAGNHAQSLAYAARARGLAGAVFVHPFDDPEIVAGQGTLGLELLEEVDDIATVVVPVGGGGLISGVAGALKEARPDLHVIGVQVESCAAYPESLERGEPVEAVAVPTIADGIAIKRPGGLVLPLVRASVDELVVVAENDVAEAMVLLLERAKLVVEG